MLKYLLMVFVLLSSVSYAEESPKPVNTSNTSIINKIVEENLKDVLPQDIKQSASSVKIVYLVLNSDISFSKKTFMYTIPFLLMPLYVLLVYLFLSPINTQVVENKFGLVTYHKVIKIRHVDNDIRAIVMVGLGFLFLIWCMVLLFV